MFTDYRVCCRAWCCTSSHTLILPIYCTATQGKGDRTPLVLSSFLRPVYERCGRVYNIGWIKKGGWGQTFLKDSYPWCLHGMDKGPFLCSFSASGKPLHCPFYGFADWNGFVKCLKPFTVQCMKPFTVVSTGFSQCTMSFTGQCTKPFTPIGWKSIARGRLHQFTKTNARGRLRLFRGSGGRSQ